MIIAVVILLRFIFIILFCELVDVSVHLLVADGRVRWAILHLHQPFGHRLLVGQEPRPKVPKRVTLLTVFNPSLKAPPNRQTAILLANIGIAAFRLLTTHQSTLLQTMFAYERATTKERLTMLPCSANPFPAVGVLSTNQASKYMIAASAHRWATAGPRVGHRWAAGGPPVVMQLDDNISIVSELDK